MEEDVSSPQAPLMRQNTAEAELTSDEVDLREQDLASPSWFILTLTFSAAISGLLFGYE